MSQDPAAETTAAEVAELRAEAAGLREAVALLIRSLSDATKAMEILGLPLPGPAGPPVPLTLHQGGRT
jgi:hypothetical protein